MELNTRKTNTKYIAGTLSFLVGIAGLATIAFADGEIATTVGSGVGTGWTLGTFFAFILNLILAAGFSLTLIMLAMGFIQYIMAQGDKLGVEKAQKWVTYAVIGGLGLFLVFAIRSAIAKTLGGSNYVPGNNVNI